MKRYIQVGEAGFSEKYQRFKKWKRFTPRIRDFIKEKLEKSALPMNL